MTACSFNIFVIFMAHLSFGLHPSSAFRVIQPQTMNLNWSAVITCEHNADNSSVEDIRLNSVSVGEKTKRTVLCQKGMGNCKNIIMHPESLKKCLFIMLNLGPEDMGVEYECEFTVKNNHLDLTERGKPTRLILGEKEKDFVLPPPPAHHTSVHQLIWTLSSLLLLIFLYGCTITYFYIRLMMTTRINNESESCTYVEMRKALPPNNHS